MKGEILLFGGGIDKETRLVAKREKNSEELRVVKKFDGMDGEGRERRDSRLSLLRKSRGEEVTQTDMGVD